FLLPSCPSCLRGSFLIRQNLFDRLLAEYRLNEPRRSEEREGRRKKEEGRKKIILYWEGSNVN
ncbi:hypothetical protein MEN95_20360, partial [Dolichospermum sp. ST_sed7]|nr:hypothetical protein [Dolichospermum sp. ST_sed7]